MKAKKLTTVVSQVYMAELAIGEKRFHGAGETAIEALNNMAREVPLIFMKTKAVLSLTKDGIVRRDMFYPLKLKRFCINPITRSVWAKTFAPR